MPSADEAMKALAREVARLDRESSRKPVATKVIRCEQHGPSYTCATEGCGHIACNAIRAGSCPECPKAPA